MRWSRTLAAGMAAMLLILVVKPAAAQSMGELQERFKARYPTLLALKNQGKVGETWHGYAENVKPEYAGEVARPNQTVRQFLDEENKDRLRLYTIIAEQQKTTVEKVAQRNAVRNFEKAGPEEFLRQEDGSWVQKKNMK